MTTMSRPEIHRLIDLLPDKVLAEVARFIELVLLTHLTQWII